MKNIEDRVRIESRGAPPWYVILDGNSIRRCLSESEAIECRDHIIRSLQDTLDAIDIPSVECPDCGTLILGT